MEFAAWKALFFNVHGRFPSETEIYEEALKIGAEAERLKSLLISDAALQNQKRVTIVDAVRAHTAQKASRTPFEKGYSAGLMGKSYLECPFSYIHHKYNHDQWMKGHADGQRDLKDSPSYSELDGEYY